MGKRVAIVQSNYIPWRGYFDLIGRVDEFILFDDMQYTRRDWRNRNRIKTRAGSAWITIPVEVKRKFHQRICETRIADPNWGRSHWATIRCNYAKAKYFWKYKDLLEELYLNTHDEYLSAVNRRFLEVLCKILGIQTKLSWSMQYESLPGKTERLINLCLQAGATEYLSGPSARAYVDDTQFAKAGVILSFMDYSGYAEYHQLFPPFDSYVSIIDLILNEGPNARAYMQLSRCDR